MTPCGITPRFRGLPPSVRQIAHVFLTRPPRVCPERHPVRLACIRHAASVDPEPGSNSPPSACFLVAMLGTGRHLLRRPPSVFINLVWLGQTDPAPPPRHHPSKKGSATTGHDIGHLLRLLHTMTPVTPRATCQRPRPHIRTGHGSTPLPRGDTSLPLVPEGRIALFPTLDALASLLPFLPVPIPERRTVSLPDLPAPCQGYPPCRFRRRRPPGRRRARSSRALDESSRPTSPCQDPASWRHAARSENPYAPPLHRLHRSAPLESSATVILPHPRPAAQGHSPTKTDNSYTTSRSRPHLADISPVSCRQVRPRTS